MGFGIVQVQGSSQSPAQVRDSLQTLTGSNRLDASAIKSLPSGGVLSTWQLKTANYNAVAGDRIRAQLSGSDLTITCPINPIVGDEFELQRIDTTANSLIINSNGNPFKGQTSKDGLFNNGNIGLIERISYVDNTIGWLPQHDRLTYQTHTPPIGVGTALTYVSDGDINGLFYYMGTAGLTAAFTNPVVSSAVLVQPSSIAGGDPITLTDRNLSDFYTNNVANSWIAWDLQSKQISVTKYTLRNRNNSGGYFMRNWILEGTNSMPSFDSGNINLASWTTIDTRTNDATFTTPNTFYTLTTNGSQASYRYLRYRSTGVDSTANNFLCMGEFEFYGSVI